jgi:hypothetical protein
MVSIRNLPGWTCAALLLSGATCLSGESFRQPSPPPSTVQGPRPQKLSTSDGKQHALEQETVIEQFKVATDGGALLVPVEFRGNRYWFVLDTGASRSLFDTSLRSILGDPIKSTTIRAPNRDLTVPVFRSPAGTMGKLALPTDSESFCMDLEKMREVFGQEFHGLLGMDFLRKHVFRIDFDHGEVTFLRKPGPDPGQRIPIIFRGNDPYIMVEAEGLIGQGAFLVDTGDCGFTSGSLQPEPFIALARRGFLAIEPQAPTQALTLSGTVKERRGCVSAIILGGFRHEKLVFTESNRNILGLRYWSRYVLTFDFPNSAMYIKKGRQFDQPELHDTSGLVIRRSKGLTVVEAVKRDSPSAQAGIKPRDVLLKINDVNVSKMTLIIIQRLFCKQGKNYCLRVRRGEKEIELTIHLPNRKD